MEIKPTEKRVLVADDYSDAAEMLVQLISMMSPLPIDIAIVHDGAAALAKVIADRPDCAILDVDMPVLDGASAALAIRAALGNNAPLLIAITGDSRHALSPRVQGAFDYFFEKPADADELVKLVAKARSLR